MICRYVPPKGCGTEAPGTFAIWLRTVYCAEVAQAAFRSVPRPFSVIRHTGRLDASNFSTTGGSVPGGKPSQIGHRQIRDVAHGRIAFVPGWK